MAASTSHSWNWSEKYCNKRACWIIKKGSTPPQQTWLRWRLRSSATWWWAKGRLCLADSKRLYSALEVSRLAEFVTNSMSKHSPLLKYRLRYLKHTINHGIHYSSLHKQTNAPLVTFYDSDYTTSSGRRSISGTVHTSFGEPVSWAARKQKAVALSTCEAEYVAAAHALQIILWLRRLFTSMQPDLTIQPTPFHIYNQTSFNVGRKPAPTKRRKKTDIKHHNISDHQCKKHNRTSSHCIRTQPGGHAHQTLPRSSHSTDKCTEIHQYSEEILDLRIPSGGAPGAASRSRQSCAASPFQPHYISQWH